MNFSEAMTEILQASRQRNQMTIFSMGQQKFFKAKLCYILASVTNTVNSVSIICAHQGGPNSELEIKCFLNVTGSLDLKYSGCQMECGKPFFPG